jgi:hypothetical protein
MRIARPAACSAQTALRQVAVEPALIGDGQIGFGAQEALVGAENFTAHWIASSRLIRRGVNL